MFVPSVEAIWKTYLDFFYGGIAGALTLLVSAFLLLRPSMDK